MNNTAFRANKTNIITGGLILAIIIVLLALRPGGIGGTGIGNGGVGGTGINTGFIGRIDKFGSIYVNDARIFYPADTKVQFNQRAASVDDLKIGQIVQVLASADSNGTLTASSIKVRFEVIGVVQSITDNQAIVFGEKVILPANVTYPAIGENIMISGFRRNDGVIIASRIDPAKDTTASLSEPLELPFFGQAGNVSLSGYVQQSDAGYFIYGYQLDNLDGDISLNKVITISADISGKELQVKSVERQITTLVEPKLKRSAIPVNEITEPTIIPTNTVPVPVIEKKPTIGRAINKPVIERANNVPDRVKPNNTTTEQPTRILEPSSVSQRTEQETDNSSPNSDHDLETDVVRQEDRQTIDDQEQPTQNIEREASTEPQPTDVLPVEPVITERPESVRGETRPQTTDRPPARVRPTRVDRPQRPERIDRPQRPQRPDRRG